MSVVAARGFGAAAASAGLRSAPADVAVVAADRPVPAAGVFTANPAAAAPVRLSRAHLAASGGRARAVLLNAGCANAGTGPRGDDTAFATAAAAARSLGCAVEEVLVASTGPIGPQLPATRVGEAAARAIASLEATPGAGEAAARAILTTDSRPKQVAVTGDGWTVGGMVKGAGMIRPDMATMLAVLTTDAGCDAGALREALRFAVDRSFNALNVDGCASTNDTVVALASGDSGVTPSPESLQAALTEACRDLARQMAEDAEGASRVVTLSVEGAADDATARRLGMAVADSALVRASFYGADPNWGRILGALGGSGLPFDQQALEVTYDGTVVAKGGVEAEFDRAGMRAALAAARRIGIGIRVGDGPGSAEVLTVDLTPDYVEFNAEYS